MILHCCHASASGDAKRRSPHGRGGYAIVLTSANLWPKKIAAHASALYPPRLAHFLFGRDNIASSKNSHLKLETWNLKL
jgi:hypothetical protein